MRFRSSFTVACVLVLLLLLAVLGVLQYQWTGEASVLEQQRRKASLRERLSFLELSFDYELSRVLVAFWQSPREEPGAGTQQSGRMSFAPALAQAYTRWKDSAPHPRLVREVFIAEFGTDDSPALMRLEPERGTWAAAEWPASLAAFRQVLMRHATGTATESDQRRWSAIEGRFLFPYATIPEIPAFASPLTYQGTHQRAAAGTAPMPQSNGGTGGACVIVELDREYILGELLPALAGEYLSAGGVAEYDYLVRTRREPRTVLFKTPGTDADEFVRRADAGISLLQLRLDGAPGRLKATVVHSPSELDDTTPVAEESLRERRERRPPVPTSMVRVIDGAVGLQQYWDHMAAQGGEQIYRALETAAANGWQLVVKHRAGSVEAAVARIRRRNLYVGFAILLVLAGSLVALTIAARSAHRLARQQMEFIAGITHELRTPVTAICSLSENLADGVVQPSDNIKKYGRMILDQGRRLGSLVEQTLEFAGMGLGQSRQHLEPVALDQLLDAAVQSWHAESRNLKAGVQLRYERDLPPVLADRAALSCALRNLLDNASKYSTGAAEITVTGGKADNGQVRIAVTDKGMGIAHDEQRRLFEPFFRGRDAVRLQIRGAGIGLSLVQRIVAAHRGHITVTSSPGQGSTFAMFLPAWHEEKANGKNPSRRG